MGEGEGEYGIDRARAEAELNKEMLPKVKAELTESLGKYADTHELGKYLAEKGEAAWVEFTDQKIEAIKKNDPDGYALAMVTMDARSALVGSMGKEVAHSLILNLGEKIVEGMVQHKVPPSGVSAQVGYAIDALRANGNPIDLPSEVELYKVGVASLRLEQRNGMKSGNFQYDVSSATQKEIKFQTGVGSGVGNRT